MCQSLDSPQVNLVVVHELSKPWSFMSKKDDLCNQKGSVVKADLGTNRVKDFLLLLLSASDIIMTILGLDPSAVT